MEYLILGLVAASLAVGALVLIYVALLTLALIVDWFNEQLALVSNDEDMIAFTVNQAMQNGKVKIVQGVLNQRNNKIVAGRQVVADKVSKEVDSLHDDDGVVIYN